MDHPITRNILQSGYPYVVQPVGQDDLGNELYEGDEVYVFGDKQFLIEELPYNSKKILEKIGAERKTI